MKGSMKDCFRVIGEYDDGGFSSVFSFLFQFFFLFFFFFSLPYLIDLIDITWH